MGIVSIVVEERVVVMTTCGVYSLSKTSSIVYVNFLISWCLCGFCSNFLHFGSNEVVYHWRWFDFVSSMKYLLVGLFIFPVS